MTRISDNVHPLVAAKRAANMTYRKIADEAGFSAGYLRQVGSGWRKPSYKVADGVADALTRTEEERAELATKIMRFKYRPLPVKKKYLTGKVPIKRKRNKSNQKARDAS